LFRDAAPRFGEASGGVLKTASSFETARWLASPQDEAERLASW
jgi:hypothetical protein